MVPILDLKREYQELKDEIDAAIERVLLSGGFVGGPEVAALEGELAAYLGVTQVVSCASGTDALILALRAAGVGPGDEVITTPFTFIATLEAILHVGARPVLVDIEPQTYNLNPALLEEALSPRTKAILPVHLYGQVAPMGEILAFAQKHGLLVLEDAAQAVGARYLEEGQARMAGTLGRAGAFSLYPSKNLGAYGDGGFIATNDPNLAEEARLLTAHGSKLRYQHVRALGYTSRLDALQAAILRVKLPYLEGWNARRRAIANRYTEALKHHLLTPCEMPYAHHVYHQYTVRHPERDRLAEHLRARGIGSSVHYPLPAHLQPAYRHLAKEGSLPVAEAAAREVLSLPMHPFLEEAQVEAVIEAVLSF
ncbi:MAG: DegT/DnrJ/EryC1/StrS family aminotransferase [Meiothermus sp.]|uniref:DegT/DnrJ/EryC1/StrS family aminotransferase n=1 Tax=Meiothermus sp. TaxID=1955249 RepID=UPI0025F9C5E7|nr:DegT/DnrJ/EryC1/StrS family aminotransferase [Meiothermus sp.]MCS7057773.1 DegT/DnrJ/EryC1/StrS family aminotransferase [Meiothermus sp.]MCS7194616.1 DegT/DnrJ/EryC1/StrS family aminotransferase [Meiothermus sp.]MCX7740805.1 DegT/DnrJ/EryC1/StrS family aminotransferase [Meiothermus sp.]MDW8090975.1 DegT/DnrJ/EryC1/StrS family aminotransferase [Meiothermus sp.]MDW8481869.1 DegT/DnrJ/EryC1/StrS family aminotransferase [Meiothermus sp.]